jgi:hypothetical protein
MLNTAHTPSPAELRAAIARSGHPGYVIGARCRINPIRLSRLLHGRELITPDIAARILAAIEQVAMDADLRSIPKGSRPLTPAQAALIRLLAEATVKEFLEEQDGASDAPNDTAKERR